MGTHLKEQLARTSDDEAILEELFKTEIHPIKLGVLQNICISERFLKSIIDDNINDMQLMNAVASNFNCTESIFKRIMYTYPTMLGGQHIINELHRCKQRCFLVSTGDTLTS